MNLRNIIWDANRQRLRFFFRTIIFLIISSVLAVFISVFANDMSDLFEKSFLNFFVMCAILLSIYLTGKFIDKRDWSEYGITIIPVHQFIYGAIVGSTLIIIIYSTEYALGWIELRSLHFNKFSAFPFFIVFLGQILRYMAGSVFEEAFSRGYLLKNIAEAFQGKLSKSNAVLLSYFCTSSLFGILHLSNNYSSFLSTINLILLGLLFGWTVVKTGKLNFAIGLHAFWNIFQNNIFGAANSGKKTIISFLKFENNGSDLWTGGAFGPEGGLLCTIVVSAALILMMRSELFGQKKLNQKVLTN